jgi:hypothetical protein
LLKTANAAYDSLCSRDMGMKIGLDQDIRTTLLQ